MTEELPVLLHPFDERLALGVRLIDVDQKLEIDAERGRLDQRRIFRSAEAAGPMPSLKRREDVVPETAVVEAFRAAKS